MNLESGRGIATGTGTLNPKGRPRILTAVKRPGILHVGISLEIFLIVNQPE